MSTVLAPPGASSRGPLAALVIVAALVSGCGDASGSPVGAGTELAARDENGVPVTLRIDAVQKDETDPDGDVFFYDVSYRDPADGTFHKYCLPDGEGRTSAIPLAGYWDPSKAHVAAPGVLTFACLKSPLAKCVRWGYKPWKTVNGVSLHDYHLACVRMTRADYCGDGRPHTRDGTFIEIYDRLGVLRREEHPGVVFEAAWGPDGAVFVNKPRYGEGPGALVAECPDRLRGRTSADHPAGGPGELTERFPGALLFNDSRIIAEPP